SESMVPEGTESDNQAQPAQDSANLAPQKTHADTVRAQKLDSRIRTALESLMAGGNTSTQRFGQELAILTRWYYRTHKVGEIFFTNDRGELPLRRIANGAMRVYRGEKEVSGQREPGQQK